jgi:dTDP-4-amino-4,6-dideoxygalactose transaminase/acetyltransferase-like isoleucine patch superfamily enzyme
MSSPALMAKAFVHESAVVDPGAELATDVKVWHFAHVCAGASIGAGTSLGQNTFVAKNVRVGARVKVQNNVSLYEGVEIGDEVFLGPSCVFTNVINPRAFVERKHEFRRTRVGRGASIGANATIVCGHDIGEYAFVAAGATVTREVPAHALVMGTPAHRTGWVCRCGDKLAPHVGRATCARCGTSYVIERECCRALADDAVVGDVPFFDLGAQNAALDGALKAAFARVLASNQYILGSEVEHFEAELCETLGHRNAIAVSSGTDALLLALMALDIGPGDEVITSSFSFFATAGCIVRVGARPIFVDIDPLTYNLDASKVEAAISERTKAIVPVHLFGQCADMSALTQIAERRALALIEDAAQALGATHAGRPAGSFGSFGCFSFFPTKNLGGFGDGGLVTTEDDELAKRARILRSHGGAPKYFHRLVGGNFRLDALQAALLRVKLPQLAHYTAARRAHAAHYDAQFAAALPPQFLHTPEQRDAGHVFNQYVVRTARRDALREQLARDGIGSEIYYPRCLHEQSCFAELRAHSGPQPEAERASREVLALPIFPELSSAQRARVVQAVLAFFSAEARSARA